MFMCIKTNFALNYPQLLMCHKTKPTKLTREKHNGLPLEIKQVHTLYFHIYIFYRVTDEFF